MKSKKLSMMEMEIMFGSPNKVLLGTRKPRKNEGRPGCGRDAKGNGNHHGGRKRGYASPATGAEYHWVST